MSYKITQYTKDRAKEFNVIVKPSQTKPYKIDVYSPSGKLITRIGHIDYPDYPTYIKTHGRDYADIRRKNYLARSRHYKTDRGRYARILLW